VWGSSWAEEERAQFLVNLTETLAKGRFHDAVVAQRFTPAMQRTATYLNSIAEGARFYLVRLIRFSNGHVDAFEGAHRPQATAAQNNRTNVNNKVDGRDVPRLRAGRHAPCTPRTLPGSLRRTRSIGLLGNDRHLDPHADCRRRPRSVDRLGAQHRCRRLDGLTGLAMGYDIASAEIHPSITGALHAYVNAMAKLPGAVPAKAKNLSAAVFAPAAEDANMAAIEELLAQLVQASSGGD
jgi:hypothetical protein